MILFAFPGTGKTTLSKKYKQAIDLELSEIKYDNSSVQHLTKEERKAVRRPLNSPHYKEDYVRLAEFHHKKGYMVLVAINFMVSLLWAMRQWKDQHFHIFVPHWSLRREYKKRYQERGNNRKFIFEVMLVWHITTLFFQFLSLFWPELITVLEAGETLEGDLLKKGWI